MRIEGSLPTGEMEVSNVQTNEHIKVAAEKTSANEEKIDSEKITNEKVDAALKQVNSNADITSNGMKFEKDAVTEKWVVKVFNEKTGEIIRQIPDREFMEMAKKIEKAMGSIFNKEA